MDSINNKFFSQFERLNKTKIKDIIAYIYIISFFFYYAKQEVNAEGEREKEINDCARVVIRYCVCWRASLAYAFLPQPRSSDARIHVTKTNIIVSILRNRETYTECNGKNAGYITPLLHNALKCANRFVCSPHKALQYSTARNLQNLKRQQILLRQNHNY